jgi:hypothetical protein
VRRNTSLLAAAVTVLAIPLSLAASSITFTTLPSNTANRTYNGYAGALIDGVAVADLVCDDYLDPTYFPSGPFDFAVSGIGNLSAAMFGTSSGVAELTAEINYMAAAILLAGLDANPRAAASYQYALWDLFTPATPAYGNSAALLAAALNEARTSTSNGALYDRLLIYTPVNSTNQEFLRLTGTSTAGAVPEGGTLWLALAGIGIITVVTGLRRFSGRRPGAIRSAEPVRAPR